MDPEETVTITKSEYEALLQDSAMLGELEAAGVDNWEGYELALEDFNEEEGE